MNYTYLWIIIVSLIMSVVILRSENNKVEYFIVTIISIILALTKIE